MTETETVTVLPERSALTRAVQSTSPAPKYCEYSQGVEARARLYILEDIEVNLLPIEERTEIEAELKRYKDMVTAHTRAIHVERIGCYGYQILSPDPLTWRNKEGLPLLAPFSLESNTCSLGEDGFSDEFPTSVQGFYQDVIKTLRTSQFKKYATMGIGITLSVSIMILIFLQPWAWSIGWPVFNSLGCLFMGSIVGGFVAFFFFNHIYGWETVSIGASLGGMIPSEVREKIQLAIRQQFFQEIFILAEVQKWAKTVTRVRMPVRIAIGDPLVVGYDGHIFWLIAAFDTTSLEQHIADNYAVTTQ